MDTSAFAGHLLRGEKIAWCGQPAQGVLFTARDWLLIPFSLFWGGFAIFWEKSVLDANAPLVMKLFGVPFVLIGLYLMVGRFPVDAWIRRGTSYAVTDRRVLVLQSRPWRKLTAIGLDQLPDVNLTESADGRGTIRFGTAAPYARGLGFSAMSPALDPTVEFIAIADARKVFDLIQQQGLRRPG